MTRYDPHAGFDDVPARGQGPNRGKKPRYKDYTHPAAAWGAARSVTSVLVKQHQLISGTRAIFRMNHEDGGFDCPGCAWPDDRKGLRMDICENGIKHVAWEMTGKRCDRAFFAKHSVSELESWTAFALENEGRLTEPMVYDADTDHYVPITWDDAFRLVGDVLQKLKSPDEATFYTSGRLSNEGTFLYQLFIREFGTNNQPDCSNMCHEASGRAMTAAIGSGKGTVDLIDWQKADAVFLLGVNAASNAPRMLTALADGVKDHGTKIVHINPLVEAAAGRAITPHEVMDMLTFHATPTSSLNVQPRIGGDMALLRGIAKAALEAAASNREAIDRQFIQNHTSGFDEYRAACEQTPWETIEKQSGVAKATIIETTELYLGSQSAIFAWCLGITQHEHSVDLIREIVNVLLLRGNMGREGAGPCPIRGHSNVQGNRTCGINNQPKENWLAKMDAATGITSPRAHGLNTVTSIEAMKRGDVKVFMGLGGNFAQATPDPPYTETALRNCDLTVHVATKLNRSHIVHGKHALILPCLGRTEKDAQGAGFQSITVEDSMSMVHLSKGMKAPASEHLLSEVAIVAALARATLPTSKTPWSEYADDYDKIRDKISEAIDGFEGFNRRVRQPLGFRVRQPARELVFLTDTGKAKFSSAPLPDVIPAVGCLKLTTVRSHDQWNTTIYSDNDRYRGIKNLRTLLFMNEEDMQERGIEHLSLVNITSIGKDGSRRSLRGYTAIRYNVPRGSTAGYMPELNVLIPIGDFSAQSDQPLMKQITVEVSPAGSGEMARPDEANAPTAAS